MAAPGFAAAGAAGAVVLAAVFVWSGAAKLARPVTTTEGFAALGVPAARFTARAVPVAELALAALLLAAPRVGGMVALAVLAGFSLMLLRALGAGTSAGCNCFARARAEPVSRRDLARNAALAALAVLAATSGWR